jgi:2-polyprenyl-6-methoxyphenol hydroxylase-like FAD-dependent oxidoreductase
MAGKEWARIYSWGNDPKRKGDYELASPSEPLDLPQTLMEPLLIRYATLNGFQCRFDTQFISFVDDGEGVTTTLKDRILGQTYQVRSKYLFGADGARSSIVRQLGLPMIKRPGQGFAINVLIEADMSHLMEHRKGNLHWILQPGIDHPDYAWIGCFRMVKPWHEWLCIIFPAPGAERVVQSEELYLKRVKEMVGDDSIDVKILGISTWAINEIAAETYSKGNVWVLLNN